MEGNEKDSDPRRKARIATELAKQQLSGRPRSTSPSALLYCVAGVKRSMEHAMALLVRREPALPGAMSATIFGCQRVWISEPTSRRYPDHGYP